MTRLSLGRPGSKADIIRRIPLRRCWKMIIAFSTWLDQYLVQPLISSRLAPQYLQALKGAERPGEFVRIVKPLPFRC